MSPYVGPGVEGVGGGEALGSFPNEVGSAPANGVTTRKPRKPPSPLSLQLRAHQLADLSRSHVDAFKGDLERSNGASTAREYARHVRDLLAWAELSGLSWNALPSDVVERYFQARGWLSGNPIRNPATSAVRTFEAWARATGVPLATDLAFPPSERVPSGARAARTFGPEILAPTSPPGGPVSTAPAAAAAPAPLPTPEVVAQPHEVSPPEAVAQSVTTQAPPALNVAPSWAPPVKHTPLAPAPVQQLSRPPITAQRNKLGRLVPQSGTLRIYRVSDGTDGIRAGGSLQVGDYTEIDLEGWARIDHFIRELIHPYYTPPLRAAVSVYKVVQYDASGNAVGSPYNVELPTAGAASKVGYPGAQATPAPPAAPALPSIPGAPLSPIVTGNPDTDARIAAWTAGTNAWIAQQKEEQKSLLERYEKAKAAGVDTQGIMLQALFNKDSAEGRFKSMMDDLARLVKEGQKDAAAAAVVAAPVVPLPDSRDKLLEVMIAKQADPLETFFKLKRFEEKPASVGNDPVVVELRVQNEQLKASLAAINLKLDEKGKEPKPAPTLSNMIAERELIDNYLERKGGGTGEGAVDVLKTLMEKLPEIIAAGADLIGKFRAGKVEAPKVTERPRIPQTVADALFKMRDATGDQDVINGAFELIGALATCPEPGPTVVKALFENAQKVATYDEVYALVVQLIRDQCGMRQLLIDNPHMAPMVANCLSRHYPLVCQNIGIPQRTIKGIPPTGREGFEAPPAPQATPPAPPPTAPTTPPATVQGVVVESEGEEDEADIEPSDGPDGSDADVIARAKATRDAAAKVGAS